MRVMISGKVQAIAMDAASKFQKVRAKMAKDRADAAVQQAQTFFKSKMLKLKETAAEQVSKLKKQQSTLQGTVNKNKADQDEVNRHVNAETKRMIKLGNDHEAVLGQNDVAMKQLMAKNKESNKQAMTQLANSFNAGMDKIKKQMKKDRAHAERKLKKGAADLYA